MSEVEKNSANDTLVGKREEDASEVTETVEKAHKQEPMDIESESSKTQQIDFHQQTSKLQTLLQTKRKQIIAALTVIALAVVAFIGYTIYDSQPKSILGEVKVQFTGYEETGKLTYNDKEIATRVEELSYRKAGFSPSQANALAQKDPVAFSEVNRDSRLIAKLQKAESMIRSVQFHFDRTSELKNGDEITFTITTNSQSAAVKAEKKTFTVSDLKEYEKISTDDLLKETPVVFTGFNGYGIASITENNKGGYFHFEDNKRPTSLKNGDKVTLVVNVPYINELKSKGKVVDKDKFEVTVEGLKDLKDVKNFADLLKKNDDYSKSEHQNNSLNTYTLESQGSYLKVIPEANKKSNGKVSLVTVYKITWSSGGGSKEVRYKYYGYQAYLLKDGNLDLDAASKVAGFGSKDLEGLKAELVTEGYKVYE